MCLPDPEPRGVLVTRPERAAAATARRLTALGFSPVIAPVLRIVGVPAPMPDGPFQAIVCASANAVAYLPDAIDRATPLLAVGHATAWRAADFTNVASAGSDARALAALVGERCVPDAGKLLLACGRGQGTALASDLRARGFAVMRLAVYAAEPVADLPEAAAAALTARSLAAALFFSAETASAFVRLVVRAGLAAQISAVDGLAIGGPAAVALERLPWRRIAVAAHPDQEALLALLR